MSTTAARRVWYVAYASNLALDRFRCYLGGGPVPGGDRTYPGCRSDEEPRDIARLHLPGGLVFAGRSGVWGGGIAFLDRSAAGEVAARGYLVTQAQAADVLAQEMRQPPGGLWARDVEKQLAEVTGDLRTSGAALYDVLVHLGELDGVPMVTVTHADVASMTPVAPTAPYLRWILTGLRESHGWDLDRIGRYLAAVPGAGPAWTPSRIVRLGQDGAPDGRPARRG
jgi:hypothetical protein